MENINEKHPEQPESPPCPDEAEYQKNVRNGLREEICEAISLIDEHLAELEPNDHKNILHGLAELRDYLVRDKE